MNWRIYYGDGSTYSGPVADAPARDVQVIVQIDEDVGRWLQSGTDYYVWRVNQWWGVDIFGLFDYLIELGWKKVLFGRTLKSEEYRRIHALVDSDSDFPRKSAWKRGERRP